MSMTIPVSGKRGAGKFILVDEADFPQVSKYKWHVAGKDGNDYPARTAIVDGRKIKVKLHRELLGLKQGDGREVDHENRNRYDARRQNLREATHAENMRNRAAWKWKRPTGAADDLIDVKEAAKLMGVGEHLIRSFAKSPDLADCFSFIDGRVFVSTQRLRDRGYLTKQPAQAVSP